MTVNTRREEINETVKARKIQRTDKYWYQGISWSLDGHLTKHIKNIINRKIGTKTHVGKEQAKVR